MITLISWLVRRAAPGWRWVYLPGALLVLTSCQTITQLPSRSVESSYVGASFSLPVETALTSTFRPFWVANHRLTKLWSGAAGSPNAISFGQLGQQFCAFQVVRPQENARLFVLNPLTDNYAWINASAVGPVGPPPHQRGPKPADRSCSDVIYDGPAAPPRDERLVLALYYSWFNLGTWQTGRTADQPQVPYPSSDPAAIERHVNWARQAGIDVLVTAWYGPQDMNSTEPNFQQLLRAAAAQGLRAALLLETDSAEFFTDRTAMVQALRHFLQVHAQQPAYLRVDGRPVILVWRPITVFDSHGQRVNQKSPAAVKAWADLLDEVDPSRQALWIAEGDYFPLLEIFDGIFPYSIAWSPDPAQQLQSYGQKVRDYNARTGSQKLWVATAMPGYDDTGLSERPDRFSVRREDGAYYKRTFRGAIASNPRWIVITSFNEWLEGTQIEPAASYGSHYLDLTSSLAAAFKRLVS